MRGVGLAEQRVDYGAAGLTEAIAGDDPIALWWRWYDEAAAVYEPNAMVLATTGLDGAPQARAVLLKGLTEQGFVFFTNYDSAKARELAANPVCALVFGWFEQHRQVRITGRASKVERIESEDYFASRPRGSQLGAWASIEAGGQSTPVADRDTLDHALSTVGERFGAGEIPCPPSWGGYVVVPHSVEFWQGSTGRLLDRLRFRRTGDGWSRTRLAP